MRSVFAGVAVVGLTSALLVWLRRKRRAAVTELPSTHSTLSTSEETKSHQKIHIFFGSQTGTAESFARELAEEAIGDFDLEVNDAGSAESVETVKNWAEFFTSFSAEQKILNIVFLLSTYGEGDPSDDAVAFDEYLSSCSSETDLSHVKFAVFGLGNRQYALFNAMAKRVDKNLEKLGAKRVCSLGLGDDNADIESDFQEWKNTEFWSNFLHKCFGIDATHARENRVTRDPRDKILLEMKIAEKRGQLPFDATVHSSGGDVLSKAFFASNIVPVVSVTRLCQGKTQIDVDISKVPSLRYRAGDTLEVLPLNRKDDVEWVMQKYNLSSENFLTFTKKKGVAKLTVKKPFATPCTVSQALSRYVDLNGRPSRAVVRDLALLMGHSMEEAEKLAEETRQRLGVFTVRNLLETIFEGFENEISIGELIQILPKQKMRAYSICSSPLVDAKKISIVVSRVDDFSLASVFLSDTVKVNDTMLVNLRQGTFRLPALPAQPVIMICAGTGFAPFRAFIAELKLRSRISRDKSLLFFGCRSRTEWIYREEMEEFETLGGTLHVAFSREGEKEYVQQKVEKNLTVLSDLINGRNGIVYVCGSTAMGLAVMDVINRIASIDDLRTEKRYVEELWG